ncbi:MAG: tRNA lysidine(34) synthetase TilS [Bdellovibrionaceae bacterium]|nr:tRNA lysidine(34) synthetase TilS [Pseudobdellovibrionaceae bacterium]
MKKPAGALKARFGLEHRLWERLKKDGLRGRGFLLACSGGADSVALVRAFAAVQAKKNLRVAHLHHGPGGAGAFRDEARQFVRDLARDLDLAFVEAHHGGEILRGEAACRDFRRQWLERWREEFAMDAVVTAHHAEDLLETRLIRLVRGTGPGGLRAIPVWRAPWYRPFLGFSPDELRGYLEKINQSWCEDPSNQDPRFLRNWLRQNWLPALEAYRPGSKGALGRSLEDVAASVPKISLPVRSASRSWAVRRAEWETWSPGERLQQLAVGLRHAGVANFTRGQLEEIHRRLDKNQKDYSFQLAGCVWTVGAEQIQARLVVAPLK